MLRLVLLCWLIQLTTCKDGLVIKYESPVLMFELPDNEQTIDSVHFQYSVNGQDSIGQGFLLSDGWYYQPRDVILDDSDVVEVSAVAYDVNGNILHKTPVSTFTLNDSKVFNLPGRRIRGAVIFRDDFNSLNLANWRYEVSMFGGRNWEFQVYTNDPENVFTRNGILFLQPTLTVNDPRFSESFLRNGIMDVEQIWGFCTNGANFGCRREGRFGLLPPIKSGKITSVPSLRYGIVEVRARIPQGDWLWPVIWMLPRDRVYGAWPRSGEIDLMVSRGNTGTLGVGTVTSTLHWGTAFDNNKFYLTLAEKQSKSWHDTFHTWKLEWTSDRIITFVDNQKILEVTPGDGFWQKGGFTGNNIWASGERMAPFDQDFNIIFSVAVGGTNGFFPDNVNWGVRKPWLNSSPRAAEDFWNARNDWLPTWRGIETAMLVDWVEFRNS